MKRFIIAVSLIAFAIAFSIISLLYINNTCDTLTTHLNESVETALKKDTSQTQKNLEKAERLSKWEALIEKVKSKRKNR